MRSVRFSRFGEPAEVLSLVDVPQLEPGADQVRVRLQVRPINPYELLIVRGQYGTLPQLPAIAGMEGMGVIDASGDSTTTFRVGQRVIPLGIPGTWQDYMLANPAQLVPVPDAIDDRAASLLANPLTAWVIAVEDLMLEPGEWLLQNAATSHFGRVMIQVARLRGFRTINIVRRREQVRELVDLGADEVICTEDEDMVERVRAITDGAGVRAAIDSVGGKVGTQVVSLLKRGGVMLVFAALSGRSIAVDPGLLIKYTASVRGFWSADWLRHAKPEPLQRVVSAVLEAMASGGITPPVEAEYDLADVARAVQHSEQSGRRGKVLLLS